MPYISLSLSLSISISISLSVALCLSLFVYLPLLSHTGYVGASVAGETSASKYAIRVKLGTTSMVCPTLGFYLSLSYSLEFYRPLLVQTNTRSLLSPVTSLSLDTHTHTHTQLSLSLSDCALLLFSPVFLFCSC
jgi:hypothetical protein